ncbi:MAG: family transposase OrfB [Chthonomonadales bacterium]|nr:family transposase OrfB [Chthonomonadales bacterium]
MQITVTIKLKTSPVMASALVQTIRRCNAACDLISLVAFESRIFRKYDLHGQTYHSIKAETGLAAGHVVCAVAKVANAYKRDTHTLCIFQPLGAIELNKDTLTWKVEEQTVTLNTVCGRVKLPFLCSPAHKELLRGKRGQADLLLRDGQFYLSVAVTVAEAETFTPEGVIGIDLGIVNVATDSEGNRYTGEPIRQVRKKYRALRQELQAKKTRSARKRMAKRRRKESRFVRDVNHCVSKTLVSMAQHRKKALAVEMLQGIRERGNRLNRAMRTELNNWAFHQLKLFLTYKCKRAGVPFIELDARYSSQQCSRCAHTERANRTSQADFCCCHCCFQDHADINSAKVLEARATLSTGPRFYLTVRTARGGQAVRL